MAVRVRKLAKELERTPEDLLLLLHELGFERFRTPDDMVSHEVASKLRRAAASTPPRAIGPPSSMAQPSRSTAGSPPGSRPSPADAGDLMAQLVPGVVRKGEATPRVPRSAPPRSVPPRSEPPPAARELEAGLAAERQRLEELRAAVAVEAKAAATARAEVEEARAGLAREREAVDSAAREAEAAHERRLAGMERTSLLALLEERGLRGTDEAERALAALASHHELGRLLATWVPADPDGVRRVLSERLLLVGGTIPDALAGAPAVVVGPDRADVPGADRLARALARLGEQLLLNGLRRVFFAGVPPRWHAALREGLDRRIELAFRPAGAHLDEVGRADLVVSWNTPAPESAEPPAARARTVEVHGAGLGDLVERLTAALAA